MGGSIKAFFRGLWTNATKVWPRVLKWLLFDLACGLIPLVLHAVVHCWKGGKLEIPELIADGELALILAVLMASSLGELQLVNSKRFKSLRMTGSFCCLGIILSSGLYFALLKSGPAAPLSETQIYVNYGLFGLAVLSGASMTTMAELAGE